MDPLRNNLSPRASSVPTSSPSPPSAPTNDDIEAVIQMATSARPSPDGRTGVLRDTRTQLFVGNLPYRVRWQDLKDLFRKAGTVLRADVSLGPDNRSRGYGTVLLATAEDAGRAVDMFNGYSWQTRILEVRLDRLPPDFDNPLGSITATSTVGFSAPPQGPSSSMGITGTAEEMEHLAFFGHDLSASSISSHRNLFVGNLPFHCQWQDLKDLFRQAGTIMRADVALGQDGRSRGFGTVVFATDYDAERAVKMFNGYEYNGRALKVHHDKFSQSSQPSTTPASPTLHNAFQSASSTAASNNAANTNSFAGSMSSHPNHITLPVGYQYDYGPPSGPTSPFDIYHSQLQMSMQHQQQQMSRSYHAQPTHDIDDLGTSLASAQISSATSSSPASKPALSSNKSSSISSLSNITSTPTQSHQHPHHPGPIALPPQATFPIHPLSPHNMNLSMSPHHHPMNMSPLHHPSHQHSQIPITPHGLPPITPSMPPFTFLPPQQSPLHHPAQSAANANNNNHSHHHHHRTDVQSQNHSQVQHYIPHPFPSPSMSPPHPSSPMHHSHLHHQHVLSSFSPGVAMSPGAIWGRPGGSNPFINPAVGAPVHVHSPGHGGFFYSIPSPGHAGGGGEPAGYFDPGYFPPMASGTGSSLGASGLANEIMKDKREEKYVQPEYELQGDKSAMSQRTPTEERAEEDYGERSHSSSTATSWHSSDGDLRGWEGRDGGSVAEGGGASQTSLSTTSSRKSPGMSLAQRSISDPGDKTANSEAVSLPAFVPDVSKATLMSSA